ncbi:Nucleoside phosphorylase [Methylacidimicrobium sp. AP8]|uniref:5'-methylthioadenosine/S-adenosylhomocysteine nucleosidase family protein n=1 Tax=Methylacidimicrobium sp. AP8 TaxID=2730359 RepID=UPI0018BFA03F|nr:nucleoside phosphorylase [Methylacidimicrobium sp. AP8]CAB4242666.1 Nucleoside phosphorylase [Methylacidimicrobium sp. AP8]
MIGVAFAVKHEAGEFLAALQEKRWDKETSPPVCLGRAGGRRVAVAIIGMGRERAARGAEVLLRHSPIRLFILAGYAGALRSGIQRGQVAVAANYLNTGLALWFSGGGVPALRLATADVVVGDPESRKRLAEETGADLVDMETDAVAAIAQGRGVPFVSLRVVTDTLEDRLPVEAIAAAWESEGGTVRPLALALRLVAHPGEIGPLLRFVRFLPEARHRLTQRLMELVYSLEGSGGTSGSETD